jgi:hypothetical protein
VRGILSTYRDDSFGINSELVQTGEANLLKQEKKKKRSEIIVS